MPKRTIKKADLAAKEPEIIGYICSIHCCGDTSRRCDAKELCKRAQAVQDAVLGKED
jgi:hypothetical protein